MPPVYLGGIGDKTELMTQAGTLNIILSNGKKLKIMSYVFDTTVGESQRLCLMNTWAIEHHKVDQ